MSLPGEDPERVPTSSASACAPDGHCVTCSDEGIPMRVARVDRDTGLALCEDAGGARTEVLTALVEDVSPGDLLLVHAGTALLRLGPDPEDRA